MEGGGMNLNKPLGRPGVARRSGIVREGFHCEFTPLPQCRWECLLITDDGAEYRAEASRPPYAFSAAFDRYTKAEGKTRGGRRDDAR